MDYGTLANVVIGLGGGAIGALGWLFKLHGDVRVLKADLAGEIELRKALGAQVNGFEERIFARLDRIESKLDAKADK